MIPFGDVTIDGKSLGQAPVTTRLTPGTHRVVADSPTRRLSRTLTLAPGQRKRLVLR
ncbi:MAG: PEGA domain-containing protein [Myxococcales bacterium]|nr:PEGA domain-containing protein [Myxococcales bacterium]